MSDMSTPDLPADQPEAPAPEAPAPAVEDLQAELEDLKSLETNTLPQPRHQQPDAVPVVARPASSASPTQQPESAPEVESEQLSLEDSVRALLIFVKGRRTVGDSDLDAAIADVEAALAQDEQA